MGKNHQKKSHNKSNRRCSIEKCNKLAKDKIDEEYLCRIHSPMREAVWKKEKKKK